jgi:hypothetical protein
VGVVVSIGSTSPFELAGVVVVAVVGIALVSTPVLLYTGDVSVTVTGVEESDVFLEVEDEVEQSLLGQPTLTIHIDAGAQVKEVSSVTVTGKRVDSERLDTKTTTIQIQCEPGTTCLIRATGFDGTVLDEISVAVNKDDLL